MQLDHLVVAGRTLAEATEGVEAALGVRLQPGGQHGLFGTHNTLLGLADGLYLEAIAVDPAGLTPARPRWYDLDRFDGPPRLSNWACATRDMAQALARWPGAGAPVAVRRGDLSWQMAVPETGDLPFDNLHPAVLQWEDGGHPSDRLAASGCGLKRLIVTHPEAAALEALVRLALSDPRVVFEPGAAALRAEIDTPHGLRMLS